MQEISMPKARANASDRYSALARQIDKKYAESLESREDLSRLIDHTKRVTNISWRDLTRYFLPDIQPVENCLGSDLCHSRWHGFGSRPGLADHLEVSVYVALRTLETLNFEGYWKKWSGLSKHSLPKGSDLSPEALASLDAEWHRSWLKTAFRCALCLPIGYLISQTVIRGHAGRAPGWSPIEQDLDDYISKFGEVTFSTSETERISPKLVSVCTYHRLFDLSHARGVPMLSLAFADFFRDKPSIENPIAIAFHDALKHCFYDRIYDRLPYWWCLLLNHHFLYDEDYVPVSCTLPSEFAPKPRLITRGTELDTQPVSSPSPSASDVPEAPSMAFSDSQTSPDSDVLLSPSPDSSGDSPRSLSPLTQRCIQNCIASVASGDYRINTGGALFQAVNRHVYLVVPLFWQTLAADLAQPGVTAETIHQRFVADLLVCPASSESEEATFEIYKAELNKRLGKVRGLPLTALGLRLLFPNGFTYGNNPDLRPLRSAADASAA